MVKLISQFDNEKSKLTVATPTCGACCCCCCCCIVSAIIATGVGKRNFGGQAPDSSPAMNARHYDPTSGN
ncbi:MAG: hypothetical protein FWG53_10875, partial [Clostridiales bacterium]|nr:hypothetical protein [Clostridiales bacterium]